MGKPQTMILILVQAILLAAMLPAAAQTNEGTAPDAGEITAVKPLELADIQRLFANFNEEQKQGALRDEESFRKLIQSESANQSILAAARANNMHKNEKIAYLMQRAGDNILRETYMKRLISQQITRQFPDGFPTEEHIREYYEQNREQRYTMEERVHIWQIFLSRDGAADNAEMEQKAENIIHQIRTGELDFASAAIRYSQHDESRVNGGYMGLFGVSGLKPDIKDPLLALPVETMSKPVRTEEGVHILMRGAIIPAQVFTLDQVQTDIRNQLIQTATVQLQQVILEEAGKNYKVEIDDSQIEEWRLRLRTNTE